MSAISLKSITGITSITTPAGVDNQLTLHNNNTSEAVKLDIAGNLHFHNHLSIAGITTHQDHVAIRSSNPLILSNAANNASCQVLCDGGARLHFKSYSQTMATFENGQPTIFYTDSGQNRLQISNNGNVSIAKDLDVDGHTNLDNVSIAGITTTTESIRIQGNNKYLQVGASNQIGVVHTGGEAYIANSSGHLTHRCDVHKWENLAGSAEYLRIDSNGYVMIGNSAASAQYSKDLVIGNTTGEHGITIISQNNTVGRLLFSDSTSSGAATYQGQVNYNHSADELVLSTYTLGEIVMKTSNTERLRISDGGGIKITCAASHYSANLSEMNTGNLALNIIKTRQGQTKGIGIGAIGSTNSNTGIQAYDTSDNSANPLLLNPFGGNIGIEVTDPKSKLHLGASQDIRIGGQYGGMASMQQQVSYSSGYTGTHWQFKTTDSVSWSFDGVLIVHGTGGSSYGSEVVHIKIVYSREAGDSATGDIWRNGTSDYNIETLGHSQIGLAPSNGSLTVSHDSTPGGATTYTLLKLGWSSSGQNVGVWSKLIGNFYWASATSGDVEIQDKDGNIVFNSNP